MVKGLRLRFLWRVFISVVPLYSRRRVVPGAQTHDHLHDRPIECCSTCSLAILAFTTHFLFSRLVIKLCLELSSP